MRTSCPPPFLNLGKSNDSDEQDEGGEDGGERDSGKDNYYRIPDNDFFCPETMNSSFQLVYGLITQLNRDYTHVILILVHHARTQYLLCIGLKYLKEIGDKSLGEEMLQLHMRGTINPQ